MAGTPERPRLNVFRSLSEIYAQVIDDQVGTHLGVGLTASTMNCGRNERSEEDEQARNWWARLLAERAKGKRASNGLSSIRGGYRYIGRVKALADAAREGGLEF